MRGGRAVTAVVGLIVVTSACTSAQGAIETTTTTVSPTTTTVPPTTTTTTEPPDTTPPSIVTDPENGAVSASYVTEITVATEPGAIVTVDDQPLALDPSGTGEVSRRSAKGLNAIHIQATDESGNTTSMIYTYEFDPEQGWVAALGDSVMLGTAAEIEKRFGEGVVDATVSRQFVQGIDLARRLANRDRPPSVIIIGLGTNGPVNDKLFDEMMAGLADVPLVVFINTRVPRQWEAGTNAALASGVERYDNAVLVDWWAAADQHPELFRKDGFHPLPAGRVILADLIAAAVFPDPGLDLLTEAPGPTPGESQATLSESEGYDR